MQTRRDQLHAYRFMTRRAMSALVTGEPDTVEPPMRRLVVTTISGLMVAILVAVVFLVIGLLRPGPSEGWQADGTVLVEDGTGASYLMMGGEAYPALNYPSAVLASGSTSTVEAEQVDSDDLASVGSGSQIGIRGLPGRLPADDALSTDPVSICSQAVAEGVNVSAEVTVTTGTPDLPTAVPPDQAVVVESFGDEKDDRYLLWRGQRHLIDPDVYGALNIPGSPLAVARSFLSAVPLATPFETPDVDRLGESRRVAEGLSLKVGQLVRVEEDGSFRVMLADGLAPVDTVQYQLLLTLDFDGKTPKTRDLPAATVSEITPSDDALDDLTAQTGSLPDAVPPLSEEAIASGGVCASFSDGEPVPGLGVPSGVAPATAPTRDSDRSEQGLADVVVVPPGTGMLARSPLEAAVNLVAEPGVRYPAASLETLAGFGYADEPVLELPPELLATIPVGDALDPVDARRTTSSSSGS